MRARYSMTQQLFADTPSSLQISSVSRPISSRSGAPMWTIDTPTGTIILVGEIRAIPKTTPWEPARLEEATKQADRVILGEVREPEVLGYAQDLAASQPVVAYLVGHTAEDFGMRNVAEWLGSVFPGMPCQWFATADPYTNPA